MSTATATSYIVPSPHDLTAVIRGEAAVQRLRTADLAQAAGLSSARADDYVNPTRADLDQAMRQLLKAARVSQREAAERTGIPLVTLNRRLTGRGRDWLIPEMAALRDVVGATLVEMVQRAEQIARARLGDLSSADPTSADSLS